MTPFSETILRTVAVQARTTPAILRSPCRHATTVRKRRKVARLLSEQGLSVARIARLLNRNETTVRRYVDPEYAARRDARLREKYRTRRKWVDKLQERSKVTEFNDLNVTGVQRNGP